MTNQSTKYRKFLAGAASATLVATAIVPTALAEEVETAAADFSDVAPTHTHYDAIMQAVERGLFDGYKDGTFKPENSIDRKGVVKSLAKYVISQSEYKTFEEYIAANKLTETVAPFNDVPATHGDAELFNASLIVKDSGIFRGSNNNLMPANNITRQQMAQVLVKGFDLKDLAGVESKVTDNAKAQDQYVDYINILSENGVTAVTSFNPTTDVKRGQMASFLNRSFDVAHSEVNPAPEVVSVSAVDGKTIEVKFTGAVDAKSLKDAADKDVITVVGSDSASNAGTVTQTLSEDGKTLTLKAQAIFKGEYTVKVPFEIVKGTNGKYVSALNQKLTVNDTTAPVLETAKALIKDTKDGINNITLTFNEEVTSIDTVKINGLNYSATVNGNTATVAVDLDATKSYDITVVNATDASGNVKDVQAVALNVSVDNVAPSISKVETTGENTVKITVDEDLKDNNLELTGKVGTFNANVVTDIKVNPKNTKEYTITLDNKYLFKNGNSDTVTFTVLKDKLIDTLGNTNSTEFSTTAVVSKDVTKPDVVKVETGSTNGKVTSFSVTYSEAVVVNPNAGKISVVNSKGEILVASSVVENAEIDTDPKTVVFTLKSGLTADKYSFDLPEGFVQDTALVANDSAKHSFTVDVTEAGKPVETSFIIKNVVANENVVTVDFDAKVKATGTGSALNPSAYQVNGETLPSTTTIAFGKGQNDAVDQSKVVITLPAGFVKANDDKAIFRVTAVQTLDNKVSAPFTKTVEVTDNTAPEALSFVATELGEITVTYSEAILLAESATISDEITLTDSKGDKITITDKAVKGDKLVLKVADASAVSKLSTVASTTIDVKDAAGNAQKAGLTVNK